MYYILSNQVTKTINDLTLIQQKTEELFIENTSNKPDICKRIDKKEF